MLGKIQSQVQLTFYGICISPHEKCQKIAIAATIVVVLYHTVVCLVFFYSLQGLRPQAPRFRGVPPPTLTNIEVLELGNVS